MSPKSPLTDEHSDFQIEKRAWRIALERDDIAAKEDIR
jgi:hypothetical protein